MKLLKNRKALLLSAVSLAGIFAVLSIFTTGFFFKVFFIFTLLAGFSAILLYLNAYLRFQSTQFRKDRDQLNKELSRVIYHSEKNRDTAGSVNKLRTDVRDINESLSQLLEVATAEELEVINKIDDSLPSTHLFSLSRAPLIINIPNLGSSKSLDVSFNFEAETQARILKSGIIAIRFYDGKDEEISDVSSLKISAEYGYFQYLDLHLGLHPTYTFNLPPRTERVQFRILSWGAEEDAVSLYNSFSVGTQERFQPTSVRATSNKQQNKTRRKKLHELNVAMICDEFTYNSFAPEFNAVEILPGTWKEQFEKQPIDFFFCESAWSGIDSKTRPWKGKVYSSVNFAQENRNELLAILKHCAQEGIPTVFWNKEDPSHYYDKVHNFTDTAKHFDHVFTSDINCVERYKKDFGLTSVHPLPFAAQPKMYNPAGSFSRKDEVLFAGSWYANHTERSKVMNQIMTEVLDEGFRLRIYDRFYGTDDAQHIFPKKFQEFLYPAISHSELAQHYKEFEYGLNFNTVTDSSTMFARRVYELAASNVAVISNWSKGVEEIFGESVIFPDKYPEALSQLRKNDSSSMRHEAMRITLENHTYAHRVMDIIRVIGLDVELPQPELSLAQVLRHEDELGTLEEQVNSLGNLVSNHTLVLDKAMSPLTVSRLYNKLNRFGTSVVSAGYLDSITDSSSSPFRTDNVLLTDVDSNLDSRALREAPAHLSYSEAPISASSYSWAYRYKSSETLMGTILPAQEALSALTNTSSKSSLIYTI